MPEFRDMLRRLAADSGGSSGDLTEGALRRARAIGRKRFAAGALGAITGIALAGVAAATLVLPDDPSPAPPVNPPTESESPSDEPSEEETDDAALGDDCGRPGDDWTGWGDSDSMTELSELPDELYVSLSWQDAALTQVHRYSGGESEYVLESETTLIKLAPDGNRYVNTGGCGAVLWGIDENLESITDVGADAIYCAPSWSPDSNRVTITVPSPEYDERYLLDVATGEQTELPEEVACSPRWSPDGRYLVSLDGRVMMRADGTDMIVFNGASTWTEDEAFSGLSSISADYGRACLQLDDPEYAQSGHVDPWRCDSYVDTETGEELELPVETEQAQVVFLADGGMIIMDHSDGQLVITLFDAEGNELDNRTLDDLDASTALLMGYYTE